MQKVRARFYGIPIRVSVVVPKEFFIGLCMPDLELDDRPEGLRLIVTAESLDSALEALEDMCFSYNFDPHCNNERIPL